MNKHLTEDYKDIYFDTNYGKLYENFEGGKLEGFQFRNEYGSVSNQYIKRLIPSVIENEIYYDIITPNGYGGPIIENSLPGMKEILVSSYMEAFQKYCKSEKIVSEFIRFHPLINNVEDFTSIYDVICIRKTLGTNLKDFNDPIESEFSKSCRKNIRKALKEGVTFEVIESPDSLEDFQQVYYSTMKRNEAQNEYYFDETYFNNIILSLKENIITVKALYKEKTIAQGLYFVYGKRIHIHLSGTLSEYLYLSPAYILRYAVTLWGKENEYEMIHHGGGRTNSVEDGLYKFKKGFSKNTEFNFYTGKKIWNKEIYEKLCLLEGQDYDSEYFPSYRNKIKDV